MSRSIRNKIILISKVLVLFLGVYLASCRSDEVQKSELTPSEILSFFIKSKLKQQKVNGDYFFICDGYCKGCVFQTLYSLDSLYPSVDSSKNWRFITSSEEVKNLPFQNIDVIFDEEWAKINYDFNDVTYVKFHNDSIVISQTIESKSLDLLK